MILVSVTLSRRERDTDPEYHEALFEVLKRYISGVFAYEGVFAAVGQERGAREKRLHMQAAAGVCSYCVQKCC